MKKLLVILFSLPLLLMGCSNPAATPTPPANASSSFSCSVTQGFNFQKDSQDLIGHINYLKIGDTEMASDINVTDPMNIANYVKVFGVASGIHWNGGYAEPITFAAQVSTDNKNKLATLQHKSMANTEVEVQFTIYDYDPKTKAYYQCFHSNGVKLKGLVLKQGGELAMNISMDQSMEVVSPKNYTFQMGVMPQDTNMEIHLAFSSSDKLVKVWGVSVADNPNIAGTLLPKTTSPVTSVPRTTSNTASTTSPPRTTSNTLITTSPAPGNPPNLPGDLSKSYTCSVSQGFNFQKDSQELIGHINYIKIGDTEMASDLNVTDPMNIANYVKVFGVASGIHWNGGYAEPVTFAAQVSTDNKNKLATLQHKSMANTEVVLQFTIYDYDPRTKAYYQCFHTNGVKVKGLVLKQGGELAMNISLDQSNEVVSPKNYTFQLGVMPQDSAMQLFMAVSVSDKFVKPWGVEVAR